MACACRGRSKVKYRWTPPSEGPNAAMAPVTYNTEIEAKAKVLRWGGSYAPVPAGG